MLTLNSPNTQTIPDGESKKAKTFRKHFWRMIQTHLCAQLWSCHLTLLSLPKQAGKHHGSQGFVLPSSWGNAMEKLFSWCFCASIPSSVQDTWEGRYMTKSLWEQTQGWVSWMFQWKLGPKSLFPTPKWACLLAQVSCSLFFFNFFSSFWPFWGGFFVTWNPNPSPLLYGDAHTSRSRGAAAQHHVLCSGPPTECSSMSI